MDDLISRQDILRCLTDISYNICKTEGEAKVIEIAKTMVGVRSSAQPDLSEDDLRLIKKLRSYHNGTYAKVLDKLIASAQPERKTGRWIRTYDGEDEWHECSECKYVVSWKPNFCPNCGAKMEEGVV